MNFPPMNFENMNEFDVRGEILDPLLRELGYRSGTEFNIERERTLRYPRISFGRKKPTDPELRGRPDYVLEIRGVDRWTLEAKPPRLDISADDVEQAYSYAINSDVAAEFFVISNGRRLKVFRTIDGPNAHPVVEFLYEEFNERFQIFVNILGPDNVRKAALANFVDTGRPLARGLGSTANIVAGHLEYQQVYSSIPQLTAPLQKLIGLRMTVDKGFVWRNNNQISVKVSQGFFHAMHEQVSKQMGIGEAVYLSADAEISTDPKHPSIFELTNAYVWKPGQMGFDVSTMQAKLMPVGGRLATYTEAIGSLSEGAYSGRFFGSGELFFDMPNAVPIVIEMAGTFSLRLGS